MFSETFFTCVQENTWRTCLSKQGRNVIIFDGICHYISDLVYYGRYCVAVSLVHVLFRDEGKSRLSCGDRERMRGG